MYLNDRCVVRAVPCHFRVIPYSERRFQLPQNSTWWNEPVDWLQEHFSARITHPFQRRFFLLQCKNYQNVDTDLIFLKNPEQALRCHEGFVVACCQWHVPEYGAPDYTTEELKRLSSTWQARLFNAGQFASGMALYENSELIEVMGRTDLQRHVFAIDPPWDQGGFNVLVALKKPPYRNLTLPPFRMESTWAGDYPGAYEPFWEHEDQKPYMIHWAGGCLDGDRAINELFLQFMTKEETLVWKARQKVRIENKSAQYRKSIGLLGRTKIDLKKGIMGFRKLITQNHSGNNQKL